MVCFIFHYRSENIFNYSGVFFPMVPQNAGLTPSGLPVENCIKVKSLYIRSQRAPAFITSTFATQWQSRPARRAQFAGCLVLVQTSQLHHLASARPWRWTSNMRSRPYWCSMVGEIPAHQVSLLFTMCTVWLRTGPYSSYLNNWSYNRSSCLKHILSCQSNMSIRRNLQKCSLVIVRWITTQIF